MSASGTGAPVPWACSYTAARKRSTDSITGLARVGHEEVEGVVGPRQLGVDHRGLADLAQPVDEEAGVLDRRQGVPVTVEDEERRGVGAHLVDG